MSALSGGEDGAGMSGGVPGIPQLRLRPAEPGDEALILSFIRELAAYEKLSHEVVATEEELAASLFGPRPVAEVVLGFWEGAAAGFCLFFHTFSTFLGRPGLYLEDLYVKPERRGRGIGRAFFTHLAQLAVARNFGRLEWSVLDWNEPAIEFYRSVGARPLDEWTVFRLTGERLADLAANVPTARGPGG